MVFVLYYGTSMADDKAIQAHAPIQMLAPEDLLHPKEISAAPVSHGLLKDAKPKSAHTSTYKLGAGDKIKITVFGEKDLSRTYAVNEKGFISMPLIGDIRVGGVTVSEVNKILTDAFSQGYLKDPSIAIEISKFRPVYIMGEVRNPGSYEYVSAMTVLNAVAIAGGYTYRADQDDIEILRTENGASKLYEHNTGNPEVMPGDIILIKERFF